jgi:hypothetical protein
MRRLALAAPAACLLLAACQTGDPAVTTGALTGAAVGAIASDDGDRAEGALLGAVAGGAIGSITSQASQPRQCRYRYPDGSVYTADCPRGY